MIKNLIGPLGRSRSAQNTGAAAVEFAITAPLLVVLALGAADYGAYMTNAASLEGATRAVTEYARNSPECAAGGLSNSNCVTGINSFVSTLQSSATSLSSATFKLPDYPSSGTTSNVPLPAPLAATPSANYCTCTDATPTVVNCSTGTCSVGTPPDTRVIGYIRVQAALTVNPLVSYGTYTSGKSVNAQTTTRIQ
jgi:Flp pilus assembly protein TadG